MSPFELLHTPLRAARALRRWIIARVPAPPARRALAANRVVRLRGGPGWSVRVEAGTVVVTREGDPIDHVLGLGAELALPDRRLALAWALEDSLLELRPTHPNREASRHVTPPARRSRTWSTP
jgi:hypothetical protein